MVSRRNFLSICIMMATILVLFQFSFLIRDLTNNFNDNVYLPEPTENVEPSGQPAGAAVQTVLYIGSGDDAAAGIIRQWCSYTSRRFEQLGSLDDYVRPDDGGPVLLCLTEDSVTTDAQAQTLSTMVQEGQNILFCSVPRTGRLTRLPELQALLGIREVAQEQVELAGIKLFSGFLLGGEVIYSMEDEEEKLDQEICVTAPWYLRLRNTKVYMVGMLEDEGVENNDLPPLIWRNSQGSGRVFVVNGPYMQDETGLGILSAILYELQDYALYPVVNAQNLSLANFPDFALENTDAMMEIYARDMRRLQMDLIWPQFITAAQQESYRMTCFLAPQLDYSVQGDLQTDDLTFYLKQFREQDTEAGLSLDHLAGVSLKDKLAMDQAFFNASGTAYSYGAAYVNGEEKDAFLSAGLQGILKNIRTIVGVWEDDLLFYCADDIVAQGVTADGFTHPYQQDLRVRAVETALAYSNILADMKHISWPEEDEDHWETLSEDLFSNINTYWKPFAAFDKTTLTESGERVRALLAADYRDARQADTITVEAADSGQWFLLRTHGEAVSGLKGGDYVQVEDDVYLIHALEKTLQIELEERRNSQYYIP